LGQLDGHAYKRIRIGSGGNQELRCRGIVKEAWERLVGDRKNRPRWAARELERRRSPIR